MTEFTKAQREAHDMVVAVQEQIRAQSLGTEHEGFIIEAALEYGFQPDENLETFTCTRAQLVQLALSAEGAGRVVMARAAGVPKDVALNLLEIHHNHKGEQQ